MPLVMTAGPALEPVSLAEAKAHLRVDLDDEDGLIAGLITAARLHLERELARAFISQNWDLWLDRPQSIGVIRLPLMPVQAVIGISLYDDAGSETSLAPLDQFLDKVSDPARLILRTLPLQSVRAHSGVRIAFTAGYGASGADVPPPLRQAVLLLVAHWYEQREPVLTGAGAGELPHMLTALIAPYRQVRL